MNKGIIRFEEPETMFMIADGQDDTIVRGVVEVTVYGEWNNKYILAYDLVDKKLCAYTQEELEEKEFERLVNMRQELNDEIARCNTKIHEINEYLQYFPIKIRMKYNMS